MKKRVLSAVLVLAMALSLAVPALAAGPTFSDVPEGHWAYNDVEAAAAAGVMNGTGGGLFSPDLKVSVSQFLTLVGRVVFPDTKVGENDTWYGPYITACQNGGLLDGTQVDVTDVEAEISRYNMAVILLAAAKKLGMTETLAQQSQVTDYGVIPNMYTEAVLAVYGMGLIKGDGAGNFNGNNTMARSEVATVVMRLKKVVPGGDTSVDPEQPGETKQPTDPEKPVEMQMMHLTGWLQYGSKGDPEKNGIGVDGVPFQLRYTEDYGTTYTVLAEEVTQGKWERVDSPGCFQFTTYVEKPIFDKFKDGTGQLYISAETTVNGQRYVTQDRRTDGHATIVPIASENWSRIFADLVPSDRGETVDILVNGNVEAVTYVIDSTGVGQVKHYDSGFAPYRGVLTNSTVKIYFDAQQEGVSRVLLGETTADGGSFHDTISIDTAYHRTTGAWYVVEIEAMLDGQICTQSNHLEPITLRQLAEKSIGLWVLESDEFYEQFLKHPRT